MILQIQVMWTYCLHMKHKLVRYWRSPGNYLIGQRLIDNTTLENIHLSWAQWIFVSSESSIVPQVGGALGNGQSNLHICLKRGLDCQLMSSWLLSPELWWEKSVTLAGESSPVPVVWSSAVNTFGDGVNLSACWIGKVSCDPYTPPTVCAWVTVF